MKRILIVMMIFTLSFGIIGCGKNNDNKEGVNKKNEILVKEDSLPESEGDEGEEEVEIEEKEEKSKRYSLYDKEEKNTTEKNEVNKSDNKSNKKVDNYDKTLEQIKKEMKENTWERVFDESNDWILLDNNLNVNNGEHRIKLKLRREKPMILVTAIIPFEDVKNNKVNIKLSGTKFNEYGNMFFGDKLDFTELDKSLKTRLKEVINKNNEIFETDRGKVGNYDSSISYVGNDNLLALEIAIEKVLS